MSEGQDLVSKIAENDDSYNDIKVVKSYEEGMIGFDLTTTPGTSGGAIYLREEQGPMHVVGVFNGVDKFLDADEDVIELNTGLIITQKVFDEFIGPTLASYNP